MQYRSFGLVSLSLLAAVGCETRPILVPVTGKVTMDGNPVDDAEVVFFNQNPERSPAYGYTDAHGTFRLKTYIKNKEIPGGAAPGRYDVVIRKYRKVPRVPDPQFGFQSLSDEDLNVLPEKYSKPGSLEARVDGIEPNEFVFDLDPSD